MHSSELDIFFNRLKNPHIAWPDSYDMYGERRTRVAAHMDLSDYRCYSYFKAKCKLCGEFSETSSDSDEAIFNHFAHCSRKHGYVFDEDHPIKDLADVDQQIIRSAMLFDLPNPGFENHGDCVKQYCRGKVVCAIHYS